MKGSLGIIVYSMNCSGALAHLFFMNCRGALAHGKRIGFYKLALAKFHFGLKPSLLLQSITLGINAEAIQINNISDYSD